MSLLPPVGGFSKRKLDAETGERNGTKYKVPLGPKKSIMDWHRHSQQAVKMKLRPICYSELARHRSKDSLWMGLNGSVYDCTDYVSFHPGGYEEISRGAGKDATDLFNEVHSWVNAETMLKPFLLGRLVDDPPPLKVNYTRDGNTLRIQLELACKYIFHDKRKAVLYLFTEKNYLYRAIKISTEFEHLKYLSETEISLELLESEETFISAETLNHEEKFPIVCTNCMNLKTQSNSKTNSFIYSFKFSNMVFYENTEMNSSDKTTLHVILKNSKGTERPYTIIKNSKSGEPFEFDVFVKIYDNGAFTSKLTTSLESLTCSLPRHTETIDSRLNPNVLLIGGGTGLAPMISLSSPSSTTYFYSSDDYDHDFSIQGVLKKFLKRPIAEDFSSTPAQKWFVSGPPMFCKSIEKFAIKFNKDLTFL